MEIFIILILSLSCILLPDGNLSQTIVKEVGALLIISLFIIWWVYKYNKYLAIFIAWLVIRMFLPPQQPRAMFTLTNVMTGAMVYLAIQNLKIDKDKIYKALCITSLLQTVMVFLQFLNLAPFWNRANGGLVWGLFGNSNWSGAYIAITLPVFLYMAKRNKWYLSGLLGIPALYLLKCHFATLAAIIGLAFYLYVYFREFITEKKIHIYILVAILVATSILIMHPIKVRDFGRFEIWYRTYKLSIWNPKVTENTGNDPSQQSHFVYGRGLGSAYIILPQITPKDIQAQGLAWRQVHNEYLQVLLEYGAIGLVLIFLLLFNTFKNFQKENLILYACVLALLVDAFGFFPFRTAPLGHMGIIYLALIDRKD